MLCADERRRGKRRTIRQAWHNKVFARSVGAFYNWATQHEHVADAYLRMIVGADAGGYLHAMDAVAEVPDGSAILDAPCGGGVTIRRLPPDQNVRYVALDISPEMLERARRQVLSDHQANVEFIKADMTHMPFGDGEFDLVACFSGLHCLPDPAAAVHEITRCLRPCGRLVGDIATKGQLRRTDLFMAGGRQAGVFGPAATFVDAEGWFSDAALTVTMHHQSGALTYFEAKRKN
jgi:ubiquinone/menaquinone biosynthesis C-methylase UbiE